MEAGNFDLQLGRFSDITDEYLDNLLKQKNAKNTDMATNYAKHVFEQYVSEKENVTVEALLQTDDRCELDTVLQRFYAGCRTKTGELYKSSSMCVIRQGLYRFFNGVSSDIDIVNGAEYVGSNDIFKAVLKKLKREGKADTNHKQCIEQRHQLQLKDYFTSVISCPKGLQQYVWYCVMLYLCRRGREGQRQLTTTSFEVKERDGIKFVVQAKDEHSKNHQMPEKDVPSGGIMPEIKGSILDPVSCFQKFIEKRNRQCESLFQRPKVKCNSEDETWYDNAPLGKNTLCNMMKQISEAAALATTYTNHSIRATAITNLHDSEIPTEHIMTVSKHKSVDSVKSYWRDTNVIQKNRMAVALSDHMGIGENCDDQDASIPAKKVCKENVRVEVGCEPTTVVGSPFSENLENYAPTTDIGTVDLSQGTYDKLVAKQEIVPVVNKNLSSPSLEVKQIQQAYQSNTNKSTSSSALSGAVFNNCSININFNG